MSEEAIQRAIDIGKESRVKDIWKTIQKRRTVLINRAALFGDTVTKRAIFLNSSDLIELMASDAKRRHQTLNVADIRDKSFSRFFKVILTAEATSAYVMNLPKWQAPEVHMTLTVNDKEFQPLQGGDNDNYYPASLFEGFTSRTWFTFDIPQTQGQMKVTVISSDGHEKSKEFDSSILEP